MSFQRYSSAVIPPRMSVSCSSVKGTLPPPRSRGISMKRGLVRAAISPVTKINALDAKGGRRLRIGACCDRPELGRISKSFYDKRSAVPSPCLAEPFSACHLGRRLRSTPFLPLRYILKAEDMAFADFYVLIMGSPHPALGSPGGNWGTGSPVPPIECRASFLRLILSGFRHVVTDAVRAGLRPRVASSPSHHPPSTDCRLCIPSDAVRDCRSQPALARSCDSAPWPLP